MLYLSPGRDEYYMVAAGNSLALNQDIQEEQIVPARYRQEFLTIAWEQRSGRDFFVLLVLTFALTSSHLSICFGLQNLKPVLLVKKGLNFEDMSQFWSTGIAANDSVFLTGKPPSPYSLGASSNSQLKESKLIN
ncbi:hypothetical protein BC332_15353 [Capsicum chinense]|nr:hypothetical protein BC332_15353 [Capsicum chinense]